MDEQSILNRRNPVYTQSNSYLHSGTTSRLDNMITASSRSYIPEHLPDTSRYEYPIPGKRQRFEEHHANDLSACTPPSMHYGTSSKFLSIKFGIYGGGCYSTRNTHNFALLLLL